MICTCVFKQVENYYIHNGSFIFFSVITYYSSYINFLQFQLTDRSSGDRKMQIVFI